MFPSLPRPASCSVLWRARSISALKDRILGSEWVFYLQAALFGAKASSLGTNDVSFRRFKHGAVLGARPTHARQTGTDGLRRPPKWSHGGIDFEEDLRWPYVFVQQK
jgi:hypothetical protein